MMEAERMKKLSIPRLNAIINLYQLIDGSGALN